MPKNTSSNVKRLPPPRLSEAEWEVIKPLWTHGPMAARDIYAALPEDCGWAYKTVKTMLSRLVKKGALTFDQVGNSYLYRAAYSRAELTQAATGSFIERVFDGALRPLVAHFVEHASKEELQAIRAELEREIRKQDEQQKEP